MAMAGLATYGGSLQSMTLMQSNQNADTLVAMLGSCSPHISLQQVSRSMGGFEEASFGGQKRGLYSYAGPYGDRGAELEPGSEDGDELGGDEFSLGGHVEKKRRLSCDQVRALERNFEVDNKLEPERKMQLAKDLGLQPRQVAVWFQNRRARWKTKQLERDYEMLNSGYLKLKADFEAALREKEALKAEVQRLSGACQDSQSVDSTPCKSEVAKAKCAPVAVEDSTVDSSSELLDSDSPRTTAGTNQQQETQQQQQQQQEEVEWTWKRPALVVAKLWCVGFWDACCLNRAYYCCRRSKRVLKKTGQCFMLNVVAFLGSIFSLQKGVSPFVRWLLSAPLDSSALTSNGLLANFIVFLLYLCWLCPLYFASFVLNCLWYNEIAAHGFVALKKQASESSTEPSKEKESSVGGRSKSNSAVESLVMRIGEQIYSVIMLTFFFLEVWLLSYIPYVGQLLKFVLMSWLYAYYCFDYKWGLCRWSLEKRLLFFESNWAFFAGFGSPCVLATFFLSPLVGGGVMAVVFPIFVLVATASDPEAATNYCLNGKQSGLPRLHLFYVANKITVPTVRFLQTYWSTSDARKKTQ